MTWPCFISTLLTRIILFNPSDLKDPITTGTSSEHIWLFKFVLALSLEIQIIRNIVFLYTCIYNYYDFFFVFFIFFLLFSWQVTMGYGLWCLTPFSTIFQLNIVAVCFLGGGNYRPVPNHWQTLSCVVSSTPCHERDSSSQP